MQPLADQVVAFLLLIALGFFLGFLYDCYRVIRRIWQPKTWGTMLGDALFCLVITILSYEFLLIFTWGEVRIYVFLALLCGVVLYLKIFSRVSRKFLVRIYQIISTILVKLIGLILIPVRIIWYIVTLPFRIIRFIIVSIFKGGHKTAVIFIQPFRYRSRKPPLPPEQDF